MSITNSTFKLCFNDARGNAAGVMCMKFNDVRVGRSVVTKVSLVLSNHDIQDARTGRISGRLMEDGSGIIVTMPCQPASLCRAITRNIDGEAMADIIDPSTNLVETREV